MQLLTGSHFLVVCSISIVIVLVAIVFQYVPTRSPASTTNSKMAESAPEKAKNVYQFKVRDLDGNQIDMEKYRWARCFESRFDFEQFRVSGLLIVSVFSVFFIIHSDRGQVLLVVNTAANCGLTKGNIKELNVLHDKYKERNFHILGFPSNDFKQELDCEQDIKEFVKRNNIEFDYFGKIHVNGDEADPLYKYLKSQQSGILGSFIKWNFSKFLVNKEGIPVKRYAPTTSPSVSVFN